MMNKSISKLINKSASEPNAWCRVLWESDGGKHSYSLEGYGNYVWQAALFPSSTKGRHSEKMAIYESGSGSSPDTKSAGSLILNFSASRTMKNK